MTDFEMLVAIYNAILHRYVSNRLSVWQDSPIKELISPMPIKFIGEIGETILFEMARSLGLEVSYSDNTEYDLFLEGKRVELKTCTMNDGGTWTVNQVRNQDYDYLLVLALAPEALFYFIYTDAWQEGKSGQHGGKQNTDTQQITCKISDTHFNSLLDVVKEMA